MARTVGTYVPIPANAGHKCNNKKEELQMNKLRLRKNLRHCKLKYRGQKILLIEDKLNFDMDYFRFVKNGVTVMCIDSRMSRREKRTAFHRLINNKKLKVINRGRNCDKWLS